jgi:hypothetical protein
MGKDAVMAATTLAETFGAVKTTTDDATPSKRKRKQSLKSSVMNETTQSIIDEMVIAIKQQKNELQG